MIRVRPRGRTASACRRARGGRTQLADQLVARVIEVELVVAARVHAPDFIARGVKLFGGRQRQPIRVDDLLTNMPVIGVAEDHLAADALWVRRQLMPGQLADRAVLHVFAGIWLGVNDRCAIPSGVIACLGDVAARVGGKHDEVLGVVFVAESRRVLEQLADPREAAVTHVGLIATLPQVASDPRRRSGTQIPLVDRHRRVPSRVDDAADVAIGVISEPRLEVVRVISPQLVHRWVELHRGRQIRVGEPGVLPAQHELVVRVEEVRAHPAHPIIHPCHRNREIIVRRGPHAGIRHANPVIGVAPCLRDESVKRVVAGLERAGVSIAQINLPQAVLDRQQVAIELGTPGVPRVGVHGPRPIREVVASHRAHDRRKRDATKIMQVPARLIGPIACIANRAGNIGPKLRGDLGDMTRLVIRELQRLPARVDHPFEPVIFVVFQLDDVLVAINNPPQPTNITRCRVCFRVKDPATTIGEGQHKALITIKLTRAMIARGRPHTLRIQAKLGRSGVAIVYGDRLIWTGAKLRINVVAMVPIVPKRRPPRGRPQARSIAARPHQV
ncbi:hypothetical protein DB30_03286 [Enhygromyxa salina]|uniref:Uncharacterized protein n=1 Tax=Enhygromyxa salina TaxID=215803 RepID=A0A0C1Z2D3_9BACT|nr:hypothetical protein DB30_03286 [Enhygromyxa salina]